MLSFLLLQFYLAKRYGEPYPCIILPSFAQAYHPAKLPAATSYTFLLDDGSQVDTIQLGEIFPYVPPDYATFTAERLLTLTGEEEQEWQQLLRDQWPLSSPAVMHLERWEKRVEYNGAQPEWLRIRSGLREIRIGDGVPQ